MSIQTVKHKLIILVFGFALSISHAVAQNKTLLHVGVSEGLLNGFLETDLRIGAQFELPSTQLNTFAVYKLKGNLKYRDRGYYSGETIESYLFASHLLGVGIEPRFFNERKVSLLVGLSFLTEVGSNYKNGFINKGTPVFPTENHSDYFYHSTPFASNLWVGVDVELFKGFNLSLSLENGMRVTKERYLKWELSELDDRSLDELVNEQEAKVLFIDRIGIRLGLSYNFSF